MATRYPQFWRFWPLFCLALLTGNLTAQTNGPVVIPVVFHVLHLGGSEDISDAQVMDALSILNKDYNKQNADTIDVIPAYQNNIANMQITFRLANLDPNGNCTNGIEHIYSSQTNAGIDPLLAGHEWPRNKYLNIWVYKEFDLNPGSAINACPPWVLDTLPNEDGISILNNYLGSIGTGSTLTQRAPTNAMGFYLGLLSPCQFPNPYCLHLDSVADIPPAPTSWDYCVDTVLSCDTPLLENTQNFMCYSYCACMFTNGQRTRVYSYLNRGTAQRNNLWTQANLIATGTNDTTPTPCAPIADFCPLQRYACVGESVTFEDVSYNGPITSRLWTFQNANITTDTAKLVHVTFDTTGWQTVTLQVMNSEGSSAITKTMLYVAGNTAAYTAPYFTSFEDTAVASQTWTSINIDGDAPYFHPVSNAAHWGNSSILLNNFNSEVNWNEDDLISPAFDCSLLTDSDSQLSYWYSYATQEPDLNGTLYDSMEVSASTNCGQTWSLLYHASGLNLIKEGVDSGFFIPASINQWQQKTISLNGNLRTTDVIFKFAVFGAANSNNFYFDDFNLGNAYTGVSDIPVEQLTVFPNPFNSQVLIRGLHQAEYQLSVTDVTGRTVLCCPAVNPDKDGDAAVDLSAITASGIYFIRIGNETGMQTIKMVKQ